MKNFWINLKIGIIEKYWGIIFYVPKCLIGILNFIVCLFGAVLQFLDNLIWLICKYAKWFFIFVMVAAVTHDYGWWGYGGDKLFVGKGAIEVVGAIVLTFTLPHISNFIGKCLYWGAMLLSNKLEELDKRLLNFKNECISKSINKYVGCFADESCSTEQM